MTQLRTKATATVAALGAATLLAACGGSAHATHSTAAGSGAGGAAVSGTPASDRTLQLSIVSAHLAGAGGRSIYLWEADRHDKSSCSGACAQAWPAVLSKVKPSAGHGVRASDIGTIAHRAGGRQVTYDGHPLYYFAGDSGRGSTHGQGNDGFGAKWWLVSSSGSAITSHNASSSSSGSSAPATTTSSSSSAGGGW